MSILLACGFAFVGGLLLNLMPCVLPVLSLKIFHFINFKDSKKLRNEGLSFTAGVLVTFWLFAVLIYGLKFGGSTLGWGFQLQSPLFVAGLILLFFVMGLYMLGVFEFNPGWVGLGQNLVSKEGWVGSFFTGVLTVIAATPCSAPFMGTALGVALGQPFIVGFCILTFLGLGLAFPYLLFSLVPYFTRFLPKPGAWMETLKEFLAFPLFATCIWLTTVLFSQAGVEGVVNLMVALMSISFVFWAARKKNTSRGLLTFFAGVMAAGVTFFWIVFGEKHVSKLEWVAFDEVKIEEALKAKKPVFVDFTAEWCVTCHVNEQVALNVKSTQEKFSEKNVVLMRADWTNGDPAITKVLEHYKRNSVPFNLLFIPGKADPEILPQILTPEIVINALNKIQP